MQPGFPMLAFLCGGMEYSPDGGRQWRERMRLWVQETLNHRVYDPAEEARRLLTEEELRNLTEWKRTAVERFRKAMRIVIHHDLDVMASQADYVVCLMSLRRAAAARRRSSRPLIGKGFPFIL